MASTLLYLRHLSNYNMNNQDRINNLNTRLDSLLNWKAQHIKQQVDYPLDNISKDLIQKNLLITTGNYYGTITDNLWLEISIDGVIYWLYAESI